MTTTPNQPGPAVRDEVAERADAVATASSELREALDEVHRAEDEAWRRYAADLDAATRRLDAALSVATSRLRVEQAETHEELEDALEELAATWRARADEIRVQTHLGQMDARDAGHHALDDLDAAGHRIAEALAALRDGAGDSVGAARQRVQHTIDEVGKAVADFGRGLRTP